MTELMNAAAEADDIVIMKQVENLKTEFRSEDDDSDNSLNRCSDKKKKPKRNSIEKLKNELLFD